MAHRCFNIPTCINWSVDHKSLFSGHVKKKSPVLQMETPHRRPCPPLEAYREWASVNRRAAPETSKHRLQEATVLSALLHVCPTTAMLCCLLQSAYYKITDILKNGLRLYGRESKLCQVWSASQAEGLAFSACLQMLFCGL